MNIKHKVIKFIDKLFHLKMESSEQKVVDLKQETVDKVSEVTGTLEHAGKLQKRVMQKTTTYYLGRAAGIIK